MEPVEDAPRLDHAGVGVDVGLRRIRDHQQIALLRLEHRDVLEERGPNLLDQHVGRLRVLDVEIVRLAPEIMARGFCFRRDGVEIPHADAAPALAFGRARAGWRGGHGRTSRRRNAGGVKLMICQRSTLAVKPPAFTKVGGGGASTIQRVTATPSSVRCTLTCACSTSAGLPIVVPCTKARWVRSSRLSTTSCQLPLTWRYSPLAPQFGSSNQWKSVISSGSARAGSPIQIHSQW